MALDLFQANYQTLLIIHLKFTAKNVEIKTANLNVSLMDLKKTNFFTNARSVKKDS